VDPEGAPALIINGDDFGSSSAVNHAIIKSHRDGVLTSASLMVNEPAAGEAVALARAHPQLAVGLHLTLVLGHAALPPAEIPHLVNLNGEFSSSPARAGLNYFFSAAARRELRREMRAQFMKFAETGLPFAHVDGHNHVHMHPTVFAELVALCEEFGVKRLRLVGNEWRTHIQVERRREPAKWVLGAIFGLLARSGGRRLATREFRSPPRVYGLLRSGRMDEDYLLALIECMEMVDSEIYLHPLAPDADEDERRENPDGDRELAALLSPRVRRAIAARGFRLTNYAGL
jgi:hopanoid biosynthesis associated protein HpnK